MKNTSLIFRQCRKRLIPNFLAAALVLMPGLCGTTGSISGLVKEHSGAPIAGARITLTNTGMGTKTSVATSKGGAFNFPILLPGSYNLRAEAKGFKPQDRTGLVVHVDGAMRIDLTLEPEDSSTNQ